MCACISTVPASVGIEDSPWDSREAGLLSKIHAVVDTNGLPVRLALTAGEAHDNRLAGSREQCCSPTVAMTPIGSELLFASTASGRISHQKKRNRTEALCFSPYLYRARNLVERVATRRQCLILLKNRRIARTAGTTPGAKR